MKRVLGAIALLAFQMGGAGYAHAQAACDAGRGINDGGNADLISAVRRSLNTAAISSSNCASFVAVLRQLTSSRPRAGSQLKGSSGPDAAAAAGEIAELRKDPAQASALDAIQKEPASPFMRSMLEASHFHANGMYAARDLRLEQARQLVEGK